MGASTSVTDTFHISVHYDCHQRLQRIRIH